MSSTDTPVPRVTALLSEVLDRVGGGTRQDSEEGSSAKITLRGLMEALGERAFGLGILILALPCCLPFLYGIPQVVALPMLALAAQLAAGRHEPWLPQSLAKREVEVASLRSVVDRTQRYLGAIEKLSAPRLQWLSGGTGARLVGALMLVPAASILVPAPATNTVPGIGVAITSVGLLERDGLLIVLGLTIGIAWVFALIFFGVEAISALKDLVLGS